VQLGTSPSGLAGLRSRIPPRAVVLRNIYNTPLTLSAESNLKRQIYIRADPGGVGLVEKCPLAVGEEMTLWIFVDAVLLPGTNSRELYGGIQLFMEGVFTCTVKVSYWRSPKTSLNRIPVIIEEEKQAFYRVWFARYGLFDLMHD